MWTTEVEFCTKSSSYNPNASNTQHPCCKQKLHHSAGSFCVASTSSGADSYLTVGQAVNPPWHGRHLLKTTGTGQRLHALLKVHWAMAGGRLCVAVNKQWPSNCCAWGCTMPWHGTIHLIKRLSKHGAAYHMKSPSGANWGHAVQDAEWAWCEPTTTYERRLDHFIAHTITGVVGDDCNDSWNSKQSINQSGNIPAQPRQMMHSVQLHLKKQQHTADMSCMQHKRLGLCYTCAATTARTSVTTNMRLYLGCVAGDGTTHVFQIWSAVTSWWSVNPCTRLFSHMR